VVFDCQGNQIDTGAPTTVAAIVVNGSGSTNYTNVTIKNCDLTNSLYGIYMSQVNGGALYYNNISESAADGLHIESSSGISGDDNEVSNSGLAGIVLDDVSNSALSDSTAFGHQGSEDFSHGLQLTHPDDVSLFGITLYNNTRDFQLDRLLIGTGSVETYYLEDALFLPASGTLVNYTNLTLNDTRDDRELAYHITWTEKPYVPAWLESFNEKWVEIEPTEVGFDSQLDEVIWHWEDGEVAGYTESRLDIYRFFSAPGPMFYTLEYEELNATLNAGSNTLTQTNLFVDNDDLDYAYEKYAIIEEPISVTGCQNLTDAGGNYWLEADLDGTQSDGSSCLDIQADDITIKFNGFDIINDPGDWGTGEGISCRGHTGVKIAGSDEHVDGYKWGVRARGCPRIDVDPIYSCNNTVGVLLNDSNDSIISDTVACNNSQYGIHILDSDNVTIVDTRTYDNALDLLVNNSLGSAVTLNISWMLFDNPAGDLQAYTNLSLYDSVAAGATFTVNWTDNTETPPTGFSEFGGKFVEISGSGPISSIAYHWLDSESIYNGYNEPFLQLYEWNGSNWTLLDGTPDTVNNELSASDLNPASAYGILYNGTQNTNISLFGANVTNYSHLPRYSSTAGNTSTEGGNITGVNANISQLTERWAAFYGEVLGDVILTGQSGGDHVYSWSWDPADGGVVCVSTDSGVGFYSAYPAYGSDIDSAWSLSTTATDSGTNTFNATNCTLEIGEVSVTDTSYADTGPAGEFMTCILKSAASNVTKNDMVFCSEVIPGGTAWNGAAVDYEVMVPTPEAVATTETYYFYANLN
jgi:parallel beta-helix repeat protein